MSARMLPGKFRVFLLLSMLLLSLAVVRWTTGSMDAAPPGQTSPQDSPAETPTDIPTVTPTGQPTDDPAGDPTGEPTVQPTETPTGPPTATPTITPTKPPIRNEITFPAPEDILFGFVRVEGTALIAGYREYHLHIAPAGSGDPDNSQAWRWLDGGNRVVREHALTIFDTRLYPDGFYDMRLRAIDARGQYSESYVRGFEIRNTNPPTPTPEITRELPEGALPLPTISPLQTPEPTPTRESESYNQVGQGIYEPGNGSVLRSVQRIVGTVNGRQGKRFLRYELYLSPAGMEGWQWIYASQQQFFYDVIYRLDTSRFANGSYDLRLRIVYADSNYEDFFVRDLTIANEPGLVLAGPLLHLAQPSPGAVVAVQVDIRGTLTHPRLARWELYWAESRRAAEEAGWLLLFTGDYQVLDDLIARLDLSQTPPGVYDVRVRVVQQDGNYEDAFIRRLHVVLPTPTPIPSIHR